MAENSTKTEENVIKIPDTFDLKPRARHRPSIGIIQGEEANGNRRTLTADKVDEVKSVWTTMESRMNSNDDFFCIPQIKKERISHFKKRKSSIGVVISPPKIDTADSPLANPDDEIPINKISSFFTLKSSTDQENNIADAITSKLQEEMSLYLGRLQKSIQTTSSLIMKIQQESDILQNTLYLNIMNNRVKALIPIIKIHNLIKASKKRTQVYQGNIRRIAQVIDFIDGAKNVIESFNYSEFSKIYIMKEPPVDKLTKLVNGLDRLNAELKTVESKEWNRAFFNPTTRYFRLLRRFIDRADEMDFADIEVIINAITQNQKLMVPVRRYLFDLAWTRFMFPFTDTPQMKFPPIFDRTPKSFNAPFISEPFASMTLREINSTGWPFRIVCDDLFFILVETDPFVIADLFWEIIQGAGKVVKKINPSITDLDFDQLFSLLVVIIAAFGCDEILEVMAFSSSFEDYETKSVHRKFAMTHMHGIVEYISNLRK